MADLKQYGMDEADYQALLSAQDGHCAACPKRPTRKRLSVDHSHRTGVVRGLLCTRCNRLLGYLHDDADLLWSLAAYLHDPPAGQVFVTPRRSPDAPPEEYLV